MTDTARDDHGRGGAPGRAPDPREAILPLVPQLRAFARGLDGNVHAADDLVQDTIMLALQAWGRFIPGTNLKAWLFTILRNRFLTVRSRRHVSAEITVEHLEGLASTPAAQEQHAELRGFREAFARLSPNHREVLVLYAVHGLPYERIAEVCGCEVGSVKSRMNRARNALRRMLLDDVPAAPSVRRGGGGGPDGRRAAADASARPSPPRG